MIVVNFFGAPSAGKSATAMGLAGYLKRRQLNAEYVSEFAKDQVWSKSSHMLQNQNWVFANQELRLRMLRSEVDFAVVDSPLPLSVYYAPESYPPSFRELCFYFYEQYQNINFFLRRSHDFSPVGRLQNEDESLAMEPTMHSFLVDQGIPFTELSADEAAPEALYALLQRMGLVPA